VGYDERTVMEALEALKTRQYVLQVTLAGARVQKFKHNMERKFPQLEEPETALLTTLLLRGAQTVGELRQRAERMQVFPDLGAVEDALRRLMSPEHGEPLVVCFPPGPGRKSALYMHTLGGTPETPTAAQVAVAPVSLPPRASLDDEWKAQIQAQIDALRTEVESLKAALMA
jgi:uncharacterized protein YceH (UPF0502 family)